MINFAEIPSPCFVLDEQAFRKNLAKLESVQKESGATLLLALKGFAMFSVFDLIRPVVAGAAASSLNETRLCHDELQLPAHSYSPAYMPAEFGEICSYSSHITFNSLSQWDRFKPSIEALETPVACGLRINPGHSETETALYDPCAPGSRLGIDSATLGQTLPAGISGLHFHNLCEKGADAFARTACAVEEQFHLLLEQASWLNIGGGHLITRADYDHELLIETIQRLAQKYQLQIILEPGAAFAWQAGVLVTTVQDLVEQGDITTAVIDASITAHMPDCLEMPYKPAIRGALQPGPEKTAYRIGGVSCLAGDSFGDYSFEQPLEVGDKLIFEDMMHYTMVKTTMFNGVKHPSIGIARANGEFQLVREFGYEDYKNRLS